MSKIVYRLHPGYAMEEAVINNLVQRSGKSLVDWVALVKKSAPKEEKAAREWLKKEHNLSTNQAMFLVERANGRGGAENYHPEELVDALFSGNKAGLRPLYDILAEKLFTWAPDIGFSPAKSVVSVYGIQLLANIKPATKTRIDLGLALGNVKASGRLLETGGLATNDKITHAIAISAASEIDDTVKSWFLKAVETDKAKQARSPK